MGKPNVTVAVNERTLGVTVRMGDDLTVQVDMPRPEGIENMGEAEVHRAAQRHALRVLRAAAQDLED